MAGVGCNVCKGLGPDGTPEPGSESGSEVGHGRWRREEPRPAEPKAKGFSLRRKGPAGPEQAGGAYQCGQGQQWPLKELESSGAGLCSYGFKCVLKMLQGFSLMPQVPGP